MEESNGLLEHALVYLAAALVAVPVFKRIGLGSVLGYLVAGMAIGPWGLRLVSDPGTVLGIAKLGVVLLLFLVGIELNAQKVWTLRRAIFGLGTVQVVATIGAVTVIALLLKQSFVVGLVAGMGIAMSSTAIGLPSCMTLPAMLSPTLTGPFLMYPSESPWAAAITSSLLSSSRSMMELMRASKSPMLICTIC